jgi:hypothetical protein
MYKQLWGYKVEDKLYLGVREQKRLNTTGIVNKEEHRYAPTRKRDSSLKFRIFFWDVLPCKIIVDNYFTWQYIPEDSELHTRRRENLKSHVILVNYSHFNRSI